MPEYIVDEYILHKLVTTYIEKNLTLYSPLPNSTERVIRCRDCKHCMFETADEDTRLCFNEQWGDFGGHFVDADGMGFCSWGERRTDG